MKKNIISKTIASLTLLLTLGAFTLPALADSPVKTAPASKSKDAASTATSGMAKAPAKDPKGSASKPANGKSSDAAATK